MLARSRLALAAVLALCALPACKKDSPAQADLETFVHELGRFSLSQEIIADGARYVDTMNGGEPEEGVVEHLPQNTVAILDWSKVKISNEQVAADGSRRVDFVASICQRGENQSGCTRPDTYTFRAIVRNEGGHWRVAGATCAPLNVIR